MGNDPRETCFGADAFVRTWSDFAARMAEAGLAWSPQTPPPEGFRQLRDGVLRAWADYCDRFMRSNEFLAMMKQSMDGAIQARRQLNGLLGQAQHDLGGASRADLDAVMASLERLEQRLADEGDRVASRLDEVSERLERIEQTAAGHNGTNKTRVPAKKPPRNP